MPLHRAWNGAFRTVSSDHQRSPPGRLLPVD